MNIHKHISHWRAGSDEDWDVAQYLIQQNKIRHGLFFAHLALEKLLKAHYCHTRQKIAPMSHNLLRIADETDLSLEEEHRILLAECNAFNIEGRYPELYLPNPSREEAERYLARIGELLKCLNQMW